DICTLYPARVRLGRLARPEALLAWAAALVGAIGVASALTPEMADRFKIVHGVLPPGVPEAARVLALAFGIALIWLSRSLARRRLRQRQPVVLRASPRQELLLLAVAASVPRLPSDRGLGADQRRSGRRVGGVRRAARRVQARRARTRLAARGARRVRGAARPLPRARAAPDPGRGGGGAAAGRVLARRPGDPEGAPVGDAPHQGRLPAACRRLRGCGACATRRPRRDLGALARQPDRARILDVDRRLVRPRHGLRRRR